MPPAFADPAAANVFASWFLTTAGPSGALVLPRRMRLRLEAGQGRLVLPPGPELDAQWRASAQAAWREAHRLAGSPARDGRLEILARNPLTGASAGLSLGLLALASLLGASLPPHAATGGVLAGGYLAGGLAAQRKAEFTAGHADALGLAGAGATFLCPPVALPAAIGPLRIACATDLAVAFRRLAPQAYPAIAARHDAHRREAAAPWSRLVDTGRPFAVVASPSHAAPSRADGEGMQVALVPSLPGHAGDWLLVGGDGCLVWKTPLAELASGVRLARLAWRAASDGLA